MSMTLMGPKSSHLSMTNREDHVVTMVASSPSQSSSPIVASSKGISTISSPNTKYLYRPSHHLQPHHHHKRSQLKQSFDLAAAAAELYAAACVRIPVTNSSKLTITNAATTTIVTNHRHKYVYQTMNTNNGSSSNHHADHGNQHFHSFCNVETDVLDDECKQVNQSTILKDGQIIIMDYIDDEDEVDDDNCNEYVFDNVHHSINCQQSLDDRFDKKSTNHTQQTIIETICDNVQNEDSIDVRRPSSSCSMDDGMLYVTDSSSSTSSSLLSVSIDSSSTSSLDLSSNNNRTDVVGTPCTIKSSPWRKVRSLVTSPFIQTYKRQRYPWIQLAGHQGNFLAGQIQGTILKKKSGNEDKCFQTIMDDELFNFVPHFKKLVYLNNECMY
ncbi:hypothetical protein BLOT_016395 [Blomia tropicalis]|nr:hypothetical protein BLOT_016395 [Blomia tropicalis]